LNPHSPLWPLLALACWMASATAAIYGRKALAWVFLGLGAGLIVWPLVVTR
jgi:hypothetical protein